MRARIKQLVGDRVQAQGRRAQTAGEIFNCPINEGPDSYIVPAADAPPSAYLYIVTWDDLGVTQGVLGQFKQLARSSMQHMFKNIQVQGPETSLAPEGAKPA